MIARIWHGWTTSQNADKYETLLKKEILVGMQNRHIRGFKDIQLLRREVNNEVEFMTTLTFEAFDAVLDFFIFFWGGETWNKIANKHVNHSAEKSGFLIIRSIGEKR